MPNSNLLFNLVGTIILIVFFLRLSVFKALKSFVRMVRFRSHCNISMGVIKAATVALNANGSRRYFPVIEYLAVDGEKYNLKGNIERKNPDIGSTVKILYDKRHPHNAIIASSIYLVVLGFFYSVAVMVFLIYNLIKFIKFLK